MQAIKHARAAFILILGVLMAVVGFSAPASAAPYVNTTTTSVSNSHPTAGSTITFSGAGYLAGESIKITLDGTPIATVIASSSGTFSTKITLSSALRPGSHTLVATGATSGRTSSTKITLIRGASTGSNSAIPPKASAGLAFTGANAIGVGALGGLLLLGGAAMVLVGKRRKVNA